MGVNNKMRKLERNIQIGWLTLIAIGVVFLTYEAFKVGILIGILFLVFLLVGIAFGLRKSRQKTNNKSKKICTRCNTLRTDDVDSNICGSCADDLRMEKGTNEGIADTERD